MKTNRLRRFAVLVAVLVSCLNPSSLLAQAQKSKAITIGIVLPIEHTALNDIVSGVNYSHC